MFFIKHTTLSLAAVGIISLAALFAIVTYGIKLSPDFTGGSLVEMSFTGERPSKDVVQAAFTRAGASSVSVRDSGDSSLIVRSASLTGEQQGSISNTVAKDLNATIGRMTTVGPVIGNELYRKGMWAIFFVSLSILMYVAFAFRPQGKMSKMKVKNEAQGQGAGLLDVSSWYYGGIALLTLAHDILVPAGAIALLGHWYGIEADTLFITAILTILGYSINDTIVIFDRIREKVRSLAGKTQHVPTFPHLVGGALSETYGRSINTSLTTLIALIALYMFGPESTKMFALAMGLGVVAGTYSSIALAAPLLAWVHGKTRG
jgi:preprotein translocase subunit SecF